MQKIKFTEPRRSSGAALESCIQQRRSVRGFRDQALAEDELSQLMWSAQGVTGAEGMRAAPSAGALYPLGLYVAVGKVAALAPGVYHYLPRRHELLLVAPGDRREELAAAALGQEWIATASFLERAARGFEPNDPRMAGGGRSRRKFILPLQGDDHVGPQGFDLVILQNPPCSLNQPGRVHDHERGVGLADKLRRPDDQGQKAPDRVRAPDEEIGGWRQRREIDRVREAGERNGCRRAEAGLAYVGAHDGDLCPSPQERQKLLLPASEPPMTRTTARRCSNIKAAEVRHAEGICSSAGLLTFKASVRESLLTSRFLSGFLAGRYALDTPISLSASLVFEQSYGGVEGDSASAAELCALLSAIAEIPLRQDRSSSAKYG